MFFVLTYLFHQDEGLYAPKPLDIPEWNIAKLENRLLREDLARKIFFDEDGLLVCLLIFVTRNGLFRNLC